jgi:hypothetical protein
MEKIAEKALEKALRMLASCAKHALQQWRRRLYCTREVN